MSKIKPIKPWKKRRADVSLLFDELNRPKTPIMKRFAKKHGLKVINMKLSRRPSAKAFKGLSVMDMGSHGLGKSYFVDIFSTAKGSKAEKIMKDIILSKAKTNLLKDLLKTMPNTPRAWRRISDVLKGIELAFNERSLSNTYPPIPHPCYTHLED